MHYINATLLYWTLWGLCCPLCPLPTQQSCDCPSLRELSTSTPPEQPSCASHVAQPDSFQRNTGSTLRVMSTLMCARVTSLDSAQALPMYRCPKNPTKEKRSPWTLSLEEMRQRIFCIS